MIDDYKWIVGHQVECVMPYGGSHGAFEVYQGVVKEAKHNFVKVEYDVPSLMGRHTNTRWVNVSWICSICDYSIEKQEQ